MEKLGENSLGNVSKFAIKTLVNICVLTPSNIGVSSKHEITFPYYSNSVWLSITTVVKSTCCPAMRGGAVT